MKLLAVLLFVGLAVASPFDDTFLQENTHLFLSTKAPISKSQHDYDYSEHVDVVRTLGFCLRNYKTNGIQDVADCAGRTWRDSQSSTGFLQTLSQKALDKDVNVKVQLSDDAKVTGVQDGAKWTASGSLTINGGQALPYKRTGSLRVTKSSFTFQEESQASGDTFNASAGINIQVDFNKNSQSDVERVEAITSINHGGIVVVHNAADGSTVEAESNGQATIHSHTAAQKKGSTVNVVSGAGVSSVEHNTVHIQQKDGSIKHIHLSKSDAADVVEVLNVTVSASGVKVSAAAGVGGRGARFSDSPDARYLLEAGLTKSVSVTGTKGQFSVSSSDDVAAKIKVSDFLNHVISRGKVSGHREGKLDVSVGADKSVKAEASGKGNAELDVTPEGSTTSKKVTEQGSGEASFTSKVNSDGSVDTHLDATIQVSIHY